MSPKAIKTRLTIFKLKMANPQYFTKQSNCHSSGGDCPFCGASNGDHDEDCELDE